MNPLTDPKAQTAATKRFREDERVNAQVIRALMSTQDGRRWLWLRLSEAQLFDDIETTDPMLLVRLNGKRSWAVRLLTSITRYAPALYIRMTEENIGRTLEESPNDDTDNGSDDISYSGNG